MTIVLLKRMVLYTCTQFYLCLYIAALLCLGGVMVNVLASSAEWRGFDPRPGQTKDNKIGICCFSAKHAAFRSKSKDWSAQSQNNVYV